MHKNNPILFASETDLKRTIYTDEKNKNANGSSIIKCSCMVW